jgi:hypothetical protein
MCRLCCPSCAHGMSLPTGSTPACTHDQSKLRTTHPADAACALSSTHALVLGPDDTAPTAGDKGLAREIRSQNENGLKTAEDRWRYPLPHAPRQPPCTLQHSRGNGTCRGGNPEARPHSFAPPLAYRPILPTAPSSLVRARRLARHVQKMPRDPYRYLCPSPLTCFPSKSSSGVYPST